MTERQMEDLIAAFPNELISGHSLILRGRQQSFAGVGRFDLLFVDGFGTNVLMELKARTAKYEDASQLAKYKEALERQGERNILPWLVAPQIPNAVREFLDRIGIEYTEIHEVQFRRVAERNGVELANEQPPTATSDLIAEESRRPRSPVMGSYSQTQYNLKANFSRDELDRLIHAFGSAVRRQIDRSLADKLRSELLDTDPPHISRSTMLQLAKWCKTNNPVYWDGMEVAQKISNLLFGCVIHRNALGV